MQYKEISLGHSKQMQFESESGFSDLHSACFANIFFKMDVIDHDILDKMEHTLENLRDNILNWDVREQDIWICSYPKTGTNWLVEMVWLLSNNLDYDTALSVNMNKRAPFLEFPALVRNQLVNSGLKLDQHPLEVVNPTAFIEKSNKPMCIKTHLPWNLLPNQLQNGTKHNKILYMTRNPFDTLVSLHHYVVSYFNYKGSLEDALQDFIKGEGICCYGSYWDHFLGYFAKRHLPNLLIVRYEDLQNDLVGMIKKVAAFLKTSIKEDEILKLADHLSFEKMKKNPAVDVMYERYFKKNGDHFFRSGKVGGYKTEMTKDQIEAIKELNKTKFGSLELPVV